MIMWPDSCVLRAKTNLTIFQIGKSANYQITHHSASPPGCAPCVSLAREGGGGIGMEWGWGGRILGGFGKQGELGGVFGVWSNFEIVTVLWLQNKDRISLSIGVVTCCWSVDWIRMVHGLDKDWPQGGWAALNMFQSLICQMQEPWIKSFFEDN